tara:strand:+ start:22 stop:387 length:366 start_codon:yes stop_codon:yes gene_type:complete
MGLDYFLLLLNVIISILHPIKHIPQILHMVNTKRVEDLSKTNIICELGLNLLSVTSCILIYINMGKKTFFIPVIVEKLSSTILMITIYYLKDKYTVIPFMYEEIKPINNKNYQSLETLINV